MTIVLNILGIVAILGILYLMSPNKNEINKKMILKAFIIQIVLAFILVKFPLGQAILESNWGKSTLASKYNNLFGIKAYGDQKKVSLETKEFVNEEWITIQGDFKVYDSWEQSMNDHTQLFVQGVDWNPALYEKVITATNYQEAAQALQDAGYATDPGYAQKIIQVIETYQLNQYDRR